VPTPNPLSSLKDTNLDEYADKNMNWTRAWGEPLFTSCLRHHGRSTSEISKLNEEMWNRAKQGYKSQPEWGSCTTNYVCIVLRKKRRKEVTFTASSQFHRQTEVA